jgi:hypothetical protein
MPATVLLLLNEQHRGVWYSLDNRRLWVFKAAEVSSVAVMVQPLFRKLWQRLDTLQYTDTVELRWPNGLQPPPSHTAALAAANQFQVKMLLLLCYVFTRCYALQCLTA